MTTLQTAGEIMAALDRAKETIARQAVEIERLRKKSAAQTNLANAQAERIGALNLQQNKWHEAVNSLQSERDANALLTTEIEQLRKDAERYRLLRRGQTWSVINGIGDTLRAEQLDSSIDAVITKEAAL